VPDGEELDRRLGWLAPAVLTPTAGRLLVAGGLHDAIAVGGAALLARAWNAPLRVYPRGHLTLLLACAAVRRDVAAFAATAPPGPWPEATSSRPAARP
jgi:hypothetical protein